MSLPLAWPPSEIVRINVYAKTGTISGSDAPIEEYALVLSNIAAIIEPLSPISPWTRGANVTHRMFVAYREDIKVEHRVVERDSAGNEYPSRKYTILHIQPYRPHHIECYMMLDAPVPL